MLSVTVIIPILDSPLVAATIAYLHRQTRPPDQIIVVGRDTLHKLDPHDQRVTYIDTIESISSAEARNRGARVATSDVVCFLDPDALAAPDWLQRIMAWHERGEMVVGGGVHAPRSGYWTLCDNLLGFLDFLDTTPGGERAYLPTMNFSIRRSLFLELGGFAETFVLHAGQDTDFSFRLRRHGYRIWFDPHARVAHCPIRTSARAVRAHLWLYGASYRYIERCYRDVIGGVGVRVRLCRVLPFLALLLSPLLAVLDTLHMYRGNVALRRHWYALPGIVVARQAWYIGLVSGPDRACADPARSCGGTHA